MTVTSAQELSLIHISNVTVGEGEIFIADGYKVVQNGDWYNVVPE